MPSTFEETLKIRVRHEDGSKTFSNCNPEAEDNQMFLAAKTLLGLTDIEGASITKLVETVLVGGDL